MKKKFKKILASLMVAVMILTAVPAFSDAIAIVASAGEYIELPLWGVLEAGDSCKTRVLENGDIAYYVFEPSQSGEYVIYSSGGEDTAVAMYDESGRCLSWDDNSGEGSNFRLQSYMSRNQNYYFEIKYVDPSITGQISFTLSEAYENPSSTYTVTYDYSCNGGTEATTTNAVVDEGSVIDLTPTATKSGWNFVGWNTDPNATTGLSSLTMGSEDITLYAIYKKTLTATFIDYSGTAKKTRTATATIYNNATSGTVSAPTQNTYTGWTKRGWTKSTSADASAVSSYSISADTTYYGLYSRTLTLSYNKNGGNTTPSSQTGTQYANSYAISSTKNPSFTLAGAISKSGSTFGGWAVNSTSGTKYSAGSSISISSDTTMYAVWNINSYKVTYNYSYNGGTSATKTNVVVNEGSAIDLTPTATKSGWTFVGWNTDKNATTGLTSLKMGTGDVTLYAIYKKTLTATFIDYSGTAKKTRTATTTIYNKATSGTVSAPTQNTYTGWTSRGWATSTTANASSVSSYSISSNTTYYGLYSRTLTLSYNKNGGNTTPSSQTGTQYANSYSITSTKNPSFTLAGAISKSGSTFGGWAVNSTSGTKYSAGSSISISSNVTMYATWQTVANVYNLGEETYSFDNFSDSRSGGHCFGMSATSSGYFLGELDVKDIGIDNSSKLYTVSRTSDVQKVICYYQPIQGRYRDGACVAGGSKYLTGVNNIRSDWEEVVDYVKDHRYDNTGKLQIGFKRGTGGHAINFLRYEVVNGQERIYAYDNNFPTTETYFYMSNGNVYQAPKATYGNGVAIDCIALRDMDLYFKLAENYNASRYIYGDSDMIAIEGAIAYPMECGDDSYTMFELPEGTDQIIINPLVDNATFDYMGTDYSFGKVDDDTYGVFVLSGNDASTGGSSAQLTVMKKHGKVKSVSINDISMSYKDSATVTPSINADSGVKYTVSYSLSDSDVVSVDSNGRLTTNGTGSATITVTVTDEYGNIVTDTCKVEVSYKWWQWIIVIVLFGWIWY